MFIRKFKRWHIKGIKTSLKIYARWPECKTVSVIISIEISKQFFVNLGVRKNGNKFWTTCLSKLNTFLIYESEWFIFVQVDSQTTNPCDSKTCLNGATCVADAAKTDGYRCDCATGFTGDKCDSWYFIETGNKIKGYTSKSMQYYTVCINSCGFMSFLF